MTQIEKTEQRIAEVTNLTPEEVAVIKATVAKNTTNTELSFFLMTAKITNLNPFLKEIWCYKDNKGNLLVFAGRDGFLKIAQSDSRWNGMASSEVRAKDEFSVEPTSGKIHHKYSLGERGEIIGAYAIVKPKNVDVATVEVVDFKTYNKGHNTWNSHPADMIKKVAETKALKKAFGINGLQPEYEFITKEDVVIPINTPQIESAEDKENRRIEVFIEKAQDLKQLQQVEPHLKEQHKEKYEQKMLEL